MSARSFADATVRREVEQIERGILERCGPMRSLASPPSKGLLERADAVWCAALSRDARVAGLEDAFAEGLGVVLKSVAREFPENVFWDFEALFARFLLDSADAGGSAPRRAFELGRRVARIESLDALFGASGSVQFLYMHDIWYGFDWARWVAKDVSRRSVGPFALEFLDRMHERGCELLELIGANDSKYPTLEADGAGRNPFDFSRTPQDEEKLCRALAAQGALPVVAWQPLAVPRSDDDFDALREGVARRIGLSPGAGSSGER